MTSRIPIGAHAVFRARVSEADTAVHMGSGDVPVLATPRLVAWLEAAAVAVLADLPSGSTSVGIHIAVDHVAPTLIGADVRTEATLTAVEGKRFDFQVKAFAGDQMIAGGVHTRMMVDRRRFLTRAGIAVD